MVCIYCGEKTKTTNSRGRSKGLSTWRRRQCLDCKSVFTTEEVADTEQSIRVEKNSGLEPFLYEKLFLDVYESLSHRKTAYTDAKRLSATILSKLLPCKRGVLKDTDVIAAASEVLKRFDKAAYTYFRAHHSKTNA